MNTAVQEAPTNAALIEQVVIGGDLARLTPAQRVTYYRDVCRSLGLNPLTKPFAYLTLNSKLVLYAQRDCTDQLRKINSVSVKITDRQTMEGVYVVSAMATDKTGRSDESTGAVNIEGLTGEARCNAMMKAETKAKRRVTLSICGLGLMDETEVDSIAGAERLDPETGESTRPKRMTERREIVDKETGEVIERRVPVRPGTEPTSDNPFGFPEGDGGAGQPELQPQKDHDAEREQHEASANHVLMKVRDLPTAAEVNRYVTKYKPTINQLPKDLADMIWDAATKRMEGFPA